MPGAWRYRVSAGPSLPGVSILWLGEVESLIYNFYLSVTARQLVWADRSLRYTSMLLGLESRNQQRRPLTATAQQTHHHRHTQNTVCPSTDCTHVGVVVVVAVAVVAGRGVRSGLDRGYKWRDQCSPRRVYTVASDCLKPRQRYFKERSIYSVKKHFCVILWVSHLDSYSKSCGAGLGWLVSPLALLVGWLFYVPATC